MLYIVTAKVGEYILQLSQSRLKAGVTSFEKQPFCTMTSFLLYIVTAKVGEYILQLSQSRLEIGLTSLGK